MRRKFPVLRVLLVLGLVAGVWWWGRPWTVRSPAAASDSPAATAQASPVGQGSGAAPVGAPGAATAPANSSAGLVSESPALAVALAPFVYAQAWSADLPGAFAAFRSWSLRYVGAPDASARAGLESEGLPLARARRIAMKSLIERDPRAALAATVPAAIRTQLPVTVVAELETRFSAVGDYTVLAFDYGPLELIRRKQAGLPTDHFQSTVQWPGSSEYRAFVYGRREGQTTKHAIPLHGILLDGAAAVHESAVRVLEPGETSSGELTAEIGGQRLTFPSAEALLSVARKYAAAESGLGPRSIPALGSDTTPVTSSVPTSGSGDSALPATAWTVGAKKILHLRVDFSDLVGEPKRGSTTYTAAYVQNLADSQVNPYYAASSYGQVSLTNTVSSAVYRLPQTASYYATGNRNTQLHTDARTLASADYTLSGFDRIVVIFSSLSGLAGSQIDYGGLANVGGPYVWVNGEYDFRVAAHELGHTWGLRHANLWLVTDGNAVSAAGTSSEYDDDFDTMGANFANSLNTDFNPWFKNLLGWIADSQVQTVATSGTFRVNRFDAATATGTLALRVVRDATRNYWIATRRSFTANTSMSQGAYVVWGYNTNTTSNLLDLTTPGTGVAGAAIVADAALAPGATLLDTVGNVSLKTVATGGTAPAQYLDIEINVGLNGFPVITASPISQGFAVGATVALSVTATGTAPLAYQWTKSGVDLPGATSATYTIPNAQPYHAGSYAVRVTNTVGTANSAAAAIAVNARPVIDRPPGHVIALAGRAATFTVAATGFPAPAYQWRKGTAAISGATTATLTLTNVQTANAGDYDVVVTNSAGSVTSPVATLSVNAAPTNDAFANALPLVGPSGTAHSSNVDATGESGEPQHNTGQAGATASSVWFRWTPTVSGAAQIDTLGTVLDTGLAVYTGSVLTALTKLKEDDDGGAPGGGGPSLLTLNVTAGTTYSIAVGSFDADPRGFILLNYAVTPPPAITTQPVALTATLGGSATFSVTATGWTLAYQWYRNGAALVGATSATLALGNLTSADVGTYSVVVSNSSGSISSSSVTLAGATATASITAQPANVTVTAGQTATLSVAATVPAGATPAYQWRRNGLPISGATQSTYSKSGVTRLDADFYDVIVYSDLTPVVSQTARLAVAPTAYPTLVAPDPAWELRPESSDSAFGWAVAPISDGRAYIAGFFSTLGSTRRTGIARLAADGTVDATFAPPEIDGQIRVLAVQADGNIVIAGDFTRVGLYPRNRVARLLADGTVDATFNPGSAANAAVAALAVQADGKILLGGSFTAFAGTNRDRVVRLNADGSVDNAFLTRAFNNGVNAFAVQADGNILVGGDFTSHTDTAGAATTRNRLVRLTQSGALSATFTPSVSGNVAALAIQPDAKILVGGSFSNVSGTTVGNIARLNSDGTVDTAFAAATGAGFDNSLKAFVVQADGKILVGGLHLNYAGAASRSLTRLLDTGARDTTYLTSGFNSTVSGLGLLTTGKFVVSGAFSQHTSSTAVVSNRARFARLNADGSLDTAVNFTVRCPASINAIVPLVGGKTFVSGFFTHLRGAAVPVAAARLNADGTVDSTFNPGGSGANSNVYAAVAQPDGKVVITGFFTSYNGTTANRIARLNTDGTLDPSFVVGAGLNSSGFTLALLPGGRIFVGGGFTTVAGAAQSRVAVFLPDGSVDPAFATGTGANLTVYASASQADGKIVIGGSFTIYNGTTATRLARLNSNGSLDTTFVTTTGANSDVYAIVAQPDGKFVVGGFFNAYASVARGGLARVTSTGAHDTTFVPPTLGPVYALVMQEDARIVARGSFPSAGGVSGTGFLARFLADGTRDPSFAAAVFAQSSSAPASLVMRDQGQLLMQSTGAAGTTATQSAALPTITTAPVAQSVTAGTTVTLTVAATSTLPLAYQWQRNGTAVPGATAATLTLPNFQSANAGTYTVVITSELGSTTSAAVVVEIAVPPSITTPPADLLVTSGQAAAFSVTATGTSPLTYQWRRNGLALAAATSATYTIPATTRLDADFYDVVVTNSSGSATTPSARLSVAPTSYPTLVAPDPAWDLHPESSDAASRAVAPLPDGRAYVAGLFSSLDGTRRTHVARLAADGTLDPAFVPPEIDAFIRVLAVQSDGKLVIGGEFLRVGAYLRPRVARLNADGTVDASFDPGTGANSPVTALALQSDGKILVGGSFTNFAGSTCHSLVRLAADGSLDTTYLTRSFNAPVNALALQPDGRLLVGGDFTAHVATSGTSTARQRLVRLAGNGSLDAAFAPSLNGDVAALVVQPDGRIVAGGSFTSASGTTVGRIARFLADGTLDSAFAVASAVGFSSPVSTLCLVGDARLLVGGYFASFAGAGAIYLARLNPDGTRDTTFRTAGLDDRVIGTGLLSTGKILLTGSFTQHTSTSPTTVSNRARFARLNADGSLDTSVNFTVRGPGAINALVAGPGGKTVVAGSFTHLRGAPVPRGLARVNADGTLDAAFNAGGSGANSNIYAALLQPDGKLIITGSFTTYNGAPASRLARVTSAGTLDLAFNVGPGLDSGGYTLSLLSAGRIFVGGTFTSAGGVPRSRVAVFHPDGTHDTAFDPGTGADLTVYASLVLGDGKILLGGSFFTYNGTSAQRLVRLLPTGARDPAFVTTNGANAAIYTIAAQPDGRVIIGGFFSAYDFVARDGLARVTATGALDPSFAPPALGRVYSLLVQEDARVIARGAFTSAGGAPGTAFLARFLSDGTRDATFGAAGFGPAQFPLPALAILHDQGQLLFRSTGAAGLGATQIVALPAITTQPVAQTAPGGSTLTLTVAATSTLPLTYQWQRNGTPVSGASAATLTLDHLQSTTAGTYTVVITSELGSTTSAAVVVVQEVPAAITSHPVALTVAAGANATFSVVATGTPAPGYRWQRQPSGSESFADLANGGGYSGASTAILTVAATTAAMHGDQFRCVVDNGIGSPVTSSSALLSVNSPPLISAHPVGRVVSPGATITFSVTATSTAPLTYQWRRNGTTLPGETNATFTRTNVQTADAGDYNVIVTNPLGSVASHFAAIILIPPGTTATHTVTRSGYVAGGTVTIANTFTYPAGTTSVSLQLGQPAGWTLASVHGPAPNTGPAPGTANVLAWTWTSPPASPLTFSYTLNVPAGYNFTVNTGVPVTFRIDGVDIPLLAQPDPFFIPNAAGKHTADSNGDNKIDLLELTRVIELYNVRSGTVRTGAYAVATTATEDGFAPDATRSGPAVLTRYHSADTNTNAQLGLIELTRVIELFNTRSGTTRTGAYRVATTTTEDGFAPGP